MQRKYILLTVIALWGCENFVDVQGYTFVSEKTDSDVTADDEFISGTDPDSDSQDETETGNTNEESDADTQFNDHERDTVALADTGNDTGSDCRQTNGGIEICDGIDNNCNGDVDESVDIEGIDFATNSQHCGGCNNDCMANPLLWPEFDYVLPANMQAAACVDGHCDVSECTPGYVDLPNFSPRDCNAPEEVTTWCDAHELSEDIESGDFQCLDFDKGLPSTPWIHSGGKVKINMGDATSSPGSLNVDYGTYTWLVEGTTPATAVRFSADIKKASWRTDPSPWDDGENLICLIVGTASNCFQYQYTGNAADRFVFEKSTAQSQSPEEITLSIVPANEWIHLELFISETTADIRIDGQSALDSAVQSSWQSDEFTTVSFGAYGVRFYYDNVSVEVER